MAAIRDQVLRISEDPESLPPEERVVPGGASSLLIDHPAVLGVLHEIIGTELRLEAPGSTVRQKGGSAGPLHGGGPSQISPIFGYRTQNGQIHAGENQHATFPPACATADTSSAWRLPQAWSASSSSSPRSARATAARERPPARLPGRRCSALLCPRGSGSNLDGLPGTSSRGATR
eukprot:COSAG04_NODE_42_length_32379_cov_41.656691_9_plen_176_part_00